MYWNFQFGSLMSPIDYTNLSYWPVGNGCHKNAYENIQQLQLFLFLTHHGLYEIVFLLFIVYKKEIILSPIYLTTNDIVSIIRVWCGTHKIAINFPFWKSIRRFTTTRRCLNPSTLCQVEVRWRQRLSKGGVHPSWENQSEAQEKSCCDWT